MVEMSGRGMASGQQVKRSTQVRRWKWTNQVNVHMREPGIGREKMASGGHGVVMYFGALALKAGVCPLLNILLMPGRTRRWSAGE